MPDIEGIVSHCTRLPLLRVEYLPNRVLKDIWSKCIVTFFVLFTKTIVELRPMKNVVLRSYPFTLLCLSTETEEKHQLSSGHCDLHD